jgi:LysM repeat protein
MAKRYQRVIRIRMSKKNRQHNGQKIPKSNQNPYVEEEQTTQWPKEKVQKDKQRSTKHTHKTKDRLTRSSITLITIHLHTIVMRSSTMCLANVIKATLRRPIS